MRRIGSLTFLLILFLLTIGTLSTQEVLANQTKYRPQQSFTLSGARWCSYYTGARLSILSSLQEVQSYA